MRGKKQAPKRKIQPEIKYGNLMVAKFINYIMRGGKKVTAQRIVYGSFDLIKEKTKKDPVEVFDQAIRNVEPSLEVVGRRVGGANYQIPIPVREKRRFNLACRWIIEAARAKKGKPIAEKLASEIIDAANNDGAAVKKKNDIYRMAESNKAFAHFIR